MKKIKLTIYTLAKYIGLFWLAKRVTKRKLRILCYHGISLDKEHEVFDKLFMRLDTYKQRMHYLKKAKVPVLPLDEAVDKLYRNELQDLSTVITFDDGWSGVYGETAEFMKSMSFPWTLYVTTYYMEKQTQVFNIVFQYMLAKTEQTSVAVSGIQGLDDQTFLLANDEQKNAFYNQVFQAVNENLNAEQRQQLLPQLSQWLNVNINWIIEGNCFKNITAEQCKQLSEMGVDIQLHTHRHRFPTQDIEASKREIEENKTILEAITGKTLLHLCYPSGEHSQEQFTMMEALGLKSATTVNIALNTPQSHKYELTRFLDGENISQIEFEAEVCGFSHLMRKMFH